MFQVFGTQLMTGSVTAFIMDNRWIMCQLLFAVYMSILAIMDIKWKKLSLSVAIMDIKWKKLSLSVLLSGFIILAAGLLCGRDIHMIVLAAGAGVGIVFLVVSRVTDESLGYGDSILILIMGGFLGFWNILSLLVAAFSIAALFSIFMLVRKKFHKKSAFPFVPFLTAAYIGGMIIGAY